MDTMLSPEKNKDSLEKNFEHATVTATAVPTPTGWKADFGQLTPGTYTFIASIYQNNDPNPSDQDSVFNVKVS